MTKRMSRRSGGWYLLLSWVVLGSGILVGRVNGADAVRSALERGVFAEESDGDLEAASKAYLEAVRVQAETREMGATALYRLGEVYRKLGRLSDARQAFERLAREFPEQTRWVGLGAARLTHLAPKEDRKSQDSAAFQDDEELKEVRRLEALLAESPDLLNAVGVDDKTLVERAAARGRMRELRFLVESGADIKRTFPLHDAAEAGRKSAVEYLLSRGVDVNAMNRNGRTALHLAAEQGRTAVVETLIQAGAFTEARVLPKVMNSIRPPEGNMSLIDGGVVQLATPLHLAANAGHGAVIEALLRGKANIQATNRTGSTALHHAIQRGRWDIFKLLLEKGAQPDALDARGVTPALMTCSSKLGEVTRSSAQPHSPADYLRELLARGVDPNGKKGQWIGTLRAAVLVEDLELVETLLKAGANPNALVESNRPLLFTVLERQNAVQLTRLFLQHGANIHVHGRISNALGALDGNSFEWSPVFYVLRPQAQDIDLQSRNLAVLKILLEAGADPNQANPITGLTPIWSVNAPGQGEALIEAGADLDRPDRDGWPMSSRWTAPVPAESTTIPGSLAGGALRPGVVSRPPPTLLPTPFVNDWQSKHAELLRRRGGWWLRPDYNRIRLKLGPELLLAFERGKHEWNRFTALEVLMKGHGVLSGIGREWEEQGRANPSGFQLPNAMYRSGIDWTRILIHRPEPNGTNWERIPLDLSSVLFRTNCAGDFEMKWGDVIETRPMPGGGTGYLESKTFGCLKRRIRLTVEGETFERVLDPGAKQKDPETFSELGGVFEAGTLLGMMGYDSEKYALEKTVVMRRDRQTGTEARMELDLSRGIHSVDDLWLQDGDRLEFGLRKTGQAVEWAGKVTVFGSRYRVIPVRRGERLALGEILRRAGVEREPSSELGRIGVYRVGQDGNLGEQRVNWGARDAGVEKMVLGAGDLVEVPIRRVAL